METFFSVYQPLVSLQERRIAGYVSLLRARQNGTVIGADEMFSGLPPAALAAPAQRSRAALRVEAGAGTHAHRVCGIP